jgi:hypothetical protein
MVGSRVKRGPNGELSVAANGNYISEAQDPDTGLIPVVGNPTPDFILNVGNTISYKGLNFSFLFNHVQGGDLYAQTTQTLLGRGLITETIDRENTYILPGIGPDGQPNTTQINNSDFYFSNVLYGPVELGVYDATALRLQEVSLGYSLPSSLLEKTPFGSLSFTLSGFNLWYKAFNMPDGANFDPNVAGLGVGNGQGFEYLNGPSSKRYGLSVKASF